MGDVTELPQPTPRALARAARGNGRPTTRLAKAERRHAVVQMMLAGRSVEDIAAELGVRKPTIYKLVNDICEAWTKLEQHSVERIRAVQLQRIDQLVAAHYQAAIGEVKEDGTVVKPSIPATSEIRQLESLRAQITGTLAPKRVDVSGSIGMHIDADEVAKLDRAWAASGGDVVESYVREISSGE